MRLHPLISGTVALWQFQNTLTDSGPNALTLVTLDASTLHTPGGTEAYATIDSCINGFHFDGATKMWCPLTSLMLFVGDCTFEWLMKQVGTFEQAFFCAADPTGRSGGNSSDRIGSLYTYSYSSFGNAAYNNQSIGSNIPSSQYPLFLGAGQTAWGIGGFHHYAIRRSGLAMDAFVDGIKLTPGIVDIPGTAAGTERFFVGGYEGTSQATSSGSLMASVRVLNYARSDAQIAADAAFTTGPCTFRPSMTPATGGVPGGVVPAIGAAATGHMFRYAPKAFGDVYSNSKRPGGGSS